jgi:hypothetical protein
VCHEACPCVSARKPLGSGSPPARAASPGASRRAWFRPAAGRPCRTSFSAARRGRRGGRRHCVPRLSAPAWHGRAATAVRGYHANSRPSRSGPTPSGWLDRTAPRAVGTADARAATSQLGRPPQGLPLLILETSSGRLAPAASRRRSIAWGLRRISVPGRPARPRSVAPGRSRPRAIAAIDCRFPEAAGPHFTPIFLQYRGREHLQRPRRDGPGESLTRQEYRAHHRSHSLTLTTFSAWLRTTASASVPLTGETSACGSARAATRAAARGFGGVGQPLSRPTSASTPAGGSARRSSAARRRRPIPRRPRAAGDPGVDERRYVTEWCTGGEAQWPAARRGRARRRLDERRRVAASRTWHEAGSTVPPRTSVADSLASPIWREAISSTWAAAERRCRRAPGARVRHLDGSWGTLPSALRMGLDAITRDDLDVSPPGCSANQRLSVSVVRSGSRSIGDRADRLRPRRERATHVRRAVLRPRGTGSREDGRDHARGKGSRWRSAWSWSWSSYSDGKRNLLGRGGHFPARPQPGLWRRLAQRTSTAPGQGHRADQWSSARGGRR